MNPILSICIPTYNRGNFAKDSALNILNNYHEDNIEIVISDNHSSDNTQKLIEDIKDYRLKYYRNDFNMGAAFNTHLSFLRANGKYAYLTSDEDDIILDQIPYLFEVFEEYPNVAVMIGGGDLKYTKKRFPDRIYTNSFEALKEVAFQTRYMTGIIMNTQYYTDLLSDVKFDQSASVWDAYSFMYAIAKLCCCGPVITTSHLLFNQARFTMTDITNNARSDGVYYYEPQGRIDQMAVWIRTVMELPLEEKEKKYLVLKVIYDTVLLATRLFTPGYVNEVKKTVPAKDFQVYKTRVEKLSICELSREIITRGKSLYLESFQSSFDEISDDSLINYICEREQEVKRRISCCSR